MLGAEVTSGLVQADQRLLLDVVAVGAHQEVAASLGASEASIAGDHHRQGVRAAALEAVHELEIGEIGQGGVGSAVGHGGGAPCWCDEKRRSVLLRSSQG